MTAGGGDALGTVLATWRSVLAGPVTPDSSFYAAGGSSLAAAQVAAGLRRWTGRAVTTRTVLEAGTPRALAAALAAAPAAAGAVPWAPGSGGPAPASVQQSVIWFLEQMYPDSTAYNTTIAVALDGPVDDARLRAALDVLLDRHEILRTPFGTVDGELTQLPARPVRAELAEVDLGGAGPDAVPGVLLDLGRVRFDLAAPPLVRWTLLRLGPGRRVLVQVEHHLVHDGWSTWLLLSDLAAAYRSGPEAVPAPEPHGYRRFGHWQREWLAGPEAARQRDWWTGLLAGCTEPLRLPRDGARPPVFEHRGGTVERPVPAGPAAAVRSVSARLAVTPFAVLMAAYAVLLGLESGQRRFALGSMLRNRRAPEARRTVGMFVTTVALPVRDWPDRTFAELARELAGHLAEENEELPFPVVAGALRPPPDRSRNPVFQACFSFNDWPDPRLDLGPGIAAEVRFPSNGGAKFDLDTVVLPDGAGWRLLWRYYAGVLDPAGVGELADRYERLLERLAADPGVPLGELAGSRTGRP